jgi:ABC-type uncharacterized transport system permease subunit
MSTASGWGRAAFAATCVLLVYLSVRATGADLGDAAQFFLRGSMGSPLAWSRTLKELLPVALAGVAVLVALRAGLFNVGADGQFVMGALGAAVAALYVPGPGAALVGCGLGLAFGAAWAFPAGWIRAYRGGHEVISSIMLNNLARLLTLFLVKGPLRSPGEQGQTTAAFPEASHIPKLGLPGGLEASAGLLVLVAALVSLWLWERRTVAGFEQRAAGTNPTAAAWAGVSVPPVQLASMVVSGALAGLAGALFALGHEHRFYANFSPGYGFDALGVAMLAVSGAPAVLPAALLIAVVSTGTASIQTLGVPRGLSGIVLGLLLLTVGAAAGSRRKHADG